MEVAFDFVTRSLANGIGTPDLILRRVTFLRRSINSNSFDRRRCLVSAIVVALETNATDVRCANAFPDRLLVDSGSFSGYRRNVSCELPNFQLPVVSVCNGCLLYVEWNSIYSKYIYREEILVSGQAVCCLVRGSFYKWEFIG